MYGKTAISSEVAVFFMDFYHFAQKKYLISAIFQMNYRKYLGMKNNFVYN